MVMNENKMENIFISRLSRVGTVNDLEMLMLVLMAMAVHWKLYSFSKRIFLFQSLPYIHTLYIHICTEKYHEISSKD